MGDQLRHADTPPDVQQHIPTCQKAASSGRDLLPQVCERAGDKGDQLRHADTPPDVQQHIPTCQKAVPLRQGPAAAGP
ncbi:MAG: hypothetical protein O2964_11255 [Verrucomicrobia bacterium]|nr:hypothetical protein [Verrucomicrobiota bacterium]